MARLTQAALPQLAPAAAAPAYDRDTIGIGIVHLGIGAFHRAHQAVYTDDALAASGGDWAICGISLRRPDMADALGPQDGLYTLLVRDGAGDAPRVIGSVREVLAARLEAERVMDRLCDPATRIVSLTVTEKGYCHDPATGALLENHPDILADLKGDAPPRTVPGWLTAALARRHAGGLEPFTVLCCDNLPSNGDTLAAIVARFAELRSAALGHWVASAVPFPNTMVDRITPATTDEDREAVNGLIGLEDAWPVVTEPFTQWVIEDRFAAGRPDWEAGGAVMAADVHPFETMKLRLLNGTHSTMAYLGFLAGHETIADTIADPPFRALIGQMMARDITPTLTVPPGIDIAAYQADLLARYANPALKHRTYQIAMDGSQKLPQRLLGVLRDRLAADADISRLCLAVSGWMRYALGRDEAGGAIEIQDPLADRFAAVARDAGSQPADIVKGFLSLEAMFGQDLRENRRAVLTLTNCLTSLLENGAQATVARIAAG